MFEPLVVRLEAGVVSPLLRLEAELESSNLYGLGKWRKWKLTCLLFVTEQ